MAAQQRTIEYLLEQATGAGTVSAKPMFGEYRVYVDGTMIGSVCDDQLFVKPTASGRLHAEPVSDTPSYLDAKPQMLIEANRWDNAECLGELLRVTAEQSHLWPFAACFPMPDFGHSFISMSRLC